MIESKEILAVSIRGISWFRFRNGAPSLGMIAASK
jgi:hypothetical protein